MKIKQLFLCFLFIWLSSPIYSQVNTVSSGGNISNSSGSISFTFGQVFINNVEGDNGAINEGIQQPYTSEIITGIELNEIQLQLFPNPTSDIAILKVGSEYIGLLNYSLFDASGRLISTNHINSSESTIALAKLASGIYILNVRNSSQTIKSFRIIKTQ
jgi:hypothetical protein